MQPYISFVFLLKYSPTFAANCSLVPTGNDALFTPPPSEPIRPSVPIRYYYYYYYYYQSSLLFLLLLCLFWFSTLENAATHSVDYQSEQVERIREADFVEEELR